MYFTQFTAGTSKTYGSPSGSESIPPSSTCKSCSFQIWSVRKMVMVCLLAVCEKRPIPYSRMDRLSFVRLSVESVSLLLSRCVSLVSFWKIGKNAFQLIFFVANDLRFGHFFTYHMVIGISRFHNMSTNFYRLRYSRFVCAYEFVFK